jgi:hypothetical protein
MDRVAIRWVEVFFLYSVFEECLLITFWLAYSYLPAYVLGWFWITCRELDLNITCRGYPGWCSIVRAIARAEPICLDILQVECIILLTHIKVPTIGQYEIQVYQVVFLLGEIVFIKFCKWNCIVRVLYSVPTPHAKSWWHRARSWKM